MKLSPFKVWSFHAFHIIVQQHTAAVFPEMFVVCVCSP